MTKSNSARKMRRIGKPLSALGNIKGAIPSVPLPGQTEIEQLKKSIADVYQVRDALAFLIPDVHRLIYESERQRAVNVRMFQKIAEGPPKSFIVSGGPRPYSVEELLNMEADFSSEYDAMCGLVALAENLMERE